ncbi:MAG: MmgE/PrpD family protein [Candidatus Lambdaproteobacteria bacterium]|nr:MmgE/PrpD family protein [Candidatus Lambdaproteobacteria bacterium]
MNITETLCRRILATTRDSLSDTVIARAHQVVLDGLGVAVAGTEEQAPRILADHLREMGAAPSCTAIGFGFKTSPVQAAYLNGASMHVLDYEPMSSPATHATSPTLPGLLALAEITQADGRELVTALVKGIEMQGRIRIVWEAQRPERPSFHYPGVLGVMGSAVAAGHVLGLDLTQLRNALGIAASRAGTLMANVGTMTKSTHCGLAGSTGLEAALLAKRGFTGNINVIEAPLGYSEAFYGPIKDPSAMLAWGEPWRMVEPGYAIKLFPCKYTTHWGVTAALELRKQIARPQDIRSVHMRVPPIPDVNRPAPVTGLEGKFSFQYTVACALLDGAIRIPSFSDERRFRPDMAALLPKIRVEYDEKLPAAFEEMAVEVTIETTDGQRLSELCKKPRGHYGLPPISTEEHLVKVRDCLATRLSKAQVEECVQMAGSLVSLSNPDVRRLVRLLGLFAAGQAA